MKKLLNVVIVILSIVLFIQTASLIWYVVGDKQVYNNISDESELFSRLRYQDYDYLLDDVYKNEVRNVPKEGDMDALYAVAYYYENAMMYHAYQTTGDTAKAKERYDKMLEYEKQMGEYAFAKEEILEYLGIE